MNHSNGPLFWFLQAMVICGVIVHLSLLVLIIKYRSSTAIRASQPIGQSILAASGIFAFIGGSCLILPPSPAACAIADPIIFVSMTVFGSTLAAMAWRVNRILTPALSFGKADSQLVHQGVRKFWFMCMDFAKEKNMHYLTRLSYLFHRNGRNQKKERRGFTPLFVGTATLLKLIAILSLPQIALQISIVSLPSLRKAPDPIEDDLCSYPTAASLWPFLLGSILAFIPFLSALIIVHEFKTKDGSGSFIPPLVSMKLVIQKTFSTFAMTAIVLVPILAISDDINVSSYISICLLLAATMPFARCTWLKLNRTFADEKIDIMAEIMKSTGSLATERKNRIRRGMEALEFGKVYEDMGMASKSLSLYTNVLRSWHSFENETRLFDGDFSTNEIQSFSTQDCEVTVSLLKAKAGLSLKHDVMVAAKCQLKAIEIFEFSPSIHDDYDRSAILPCFYCIFRLLRDGLLEWDPFFEKALIARFVKETSASSSLHRLCAMAMNAEMKANNGVLRDALEEVAKMDKLYRPFCDKREISGNCGLDVCALAYAKSVIWYIEMNEIDNARKQYEVVIELLNNMKSTNVYEVHSILSPIISVNLVKEMWDEHAILNHYETFVVQNKQVADLPYYVHLMLIVLRSRCGKITESVDSISTWLIGLENFPLLQEADCFWASLGLSQNTLAAKACLILLKAECKLRDKIIDRGITYAASANYTIESSGSVACNNMASANNESTLSGLRLFARNLGFDERRGSIMTKAESHKSENDIAKRRRRGQRLTLPGKKTLPYQLVLQHDTIAFVGLTHDSLPSIFQTALKEEPMKRWESVYICYMADELLESFVSSDSLDAEAEVQDFRNRIKESFTALSSLLKDHVDDLNFLGVKSRCFFGSWFGWHKEGGYIHTSPCIWNVPPKLCPSNNYSWKHGAEPDSGYNAYRLGIEALITDGSPFVNELISEFDV